jgi:hypothetical protein
MARKIDPEAIKNGTLSDEEVIYLQARGKLPKDYDLSDVEGVRAPSAAMTMEDQVIPKYPLETQYTPLEEQNQLKMVVNGGIVGDDDDSGEDLPQTYETADGWSNNLRRAELSKRGLSVNGSKEEMIARLRRSDSDSTLPEDQPSPES